MCVCIIRVRVLDKTRSVRIKRNWFFNPLRARPYRSRACPIFMVHTVSNRTGRRVASVLHSDKHRKPKLGGESEPAEPYRSNIRRRSSPLKSFREISRGVLDFGGTFPALVRRRFSTVWSRTGQRVEMSLLSSPSVFNRKV